MVELILVFGSIGSIYFGIEIVDWFNREYGEIPYDGLLTGLTSLFLLFAAMAWIGDKPGGWVVLWVILTVVFYCFSFRSTLATVKRLGVNSKDAIYVYIGQFILPLGTALFIILILALLFGGGGKRKKK